MILFILMVALDGMNTEFDKDEINKVNIISGIIKMNN